MKQFNKILHLIFTVLLCFALPILFSNSTKTKILYSQDMRVEGGE